MFVIIVDKFLSISCLFNIKIDEINIFLLILIYILINKLNFNYHKLLYLIFSTS